MPWGVAQEMQKEKKKETVDLEMGGRENLPEGLTAES